MKSAYLRALNSAEDFVLDVGYLSLQVGNSAFHIFTLRVAVCNAFIFEYRKIFLRGKVSYILFRNVYQRSYIGYSRSVKISDGGEGADFSRKEKIEHIGLNYARPCRSSGSPLFIF